MRLPTIRIYSFGWLAALAILLFDASGCSGGATTAAPPPTPTSSLIVAPVGSPTVTPRPSLTPTRTPTPIVMAVEQTLTPPANQKGGVVWDIVITSKTSRQYTDLKKGTVLNTCFTNWRYSVFYVLRPDGTLQGLGSGATQTPLSCTPHALPNGSLVTTGEEISADGTQDNQAINLRLGVKSITPNPSGDNGGVVLLFNTGACPAVRRTIQIPIDSSSPSKFQFSLSDQGQLTGCAGSAKDVVQAESVFEVERDFDCGNVPPNLDQQIIDLCR